MGAAVVKGGSQHHGVLRLTRGVAEGTEAASELPRTAKEDAWCVLLVGASAAGFCDSTMISVQAWDRGSARRR